MLEKHHIIDLFCVVSDLFPFTHRGPGRPSVLSDAELITILIWHSLAQNAKTLKAVRENTFLYHRDDFPIIPSYEAFVAHTHRIFPKFVFILSYLMNAAAPVRILDSTMLPVCKPPRAESHKVAKNIAAFGKNWQGWHYGFKLHMSINLSGLISAVYFTPANVHDLHAMPKLLNEHCLFAVGDTHYGAKVMNERIKREFGTIVIAPPHPTQNKKIAVEWQIFLLNIRSKIESTSDILKEHMYLVTSFPRSVKGYFLHYVRVLVGYQIGKVASLSQG